MNEFAKELGKKMVIAAACAITARLVNRSMDAVGFYAAPKATKPKEATHG